MGCAASAPGLGVVRGPVLLSCVTWCGVVAALALLVGGGWASAAMGAAIGGGVGLLLLAASFQVDALSQIDGATQARQATPSFFYFDRGASILKRDTKANRTQDWFHGRGAGTLYIPIRG